MDGQTNQFDYRDNVNHTPTLISFLMEILYLQRDEQWKVQIGVLVLAATGQCILVLRNHLTAQQRRYKIRVQHPCDHLGMKDTNNILYFKLKQFIKNTCVYTKGTQTVS